MTFMKGGKEKETIEGVRTNEKKRKESMVSFFSTREVKLAETEVNQCRDTTVVSGPNQEIENKNLSNIEKKNPPKKTFVIN